MLYPDLTDVPQEVFGGYVSAIPPQDLPSGASSSCPDVVFPQGAVRTREGLASVYGASPIPANASINGLKTYLTPLLEHRLMVWDSLGSLYKENPEGTLGLVQSRPQGAATFYQSNTIFGREYQAFFTDAGGVDIPRQFDDTFWDRVSQQGPGDSPVAADSGTAGNIDAGLHEVSCAFLTRQGFITKAGPPRQWTAAGAKQVDLTLIPVGPSNVVARLILFTPVITAPATTGSFYSLPTGTTQLATPTVMLIADNVTQSITLDFTDAILIAAFSANYLFTQRQLGECAYTYGYNSRTAWLGERNNLQNFLNTSFDGGFSVPAPPTPHTVGANNATVTVDDGDVNTPWTGDTNVEVAAGVATASNIPVGGVSNFLRATGFGFAIPSNATITGIAASIKRKRSIASGAADDAVYLLRAGIQAGTNHAIGSNYSTGGFVAGIYGSSADLWGEGWTFNDINDPAFGVEIRSANTGGAFTASPSIEAFITITISYTTPGVGARAPLGWTQGAAYAGGSSAAANAQIVDWGDAFYIAGDGATAKRGEINQSAYQDFLRVPIIAGNTAYHVRARLARNAALLVGTIHINLTSASQAFTTVGIQIDAGQLTQQYVEFDALLTSAINNPPADLLLQVYADGTPTNTGVFLVDSIEVYPTTSPYNYSTAWLSHAFNPESFDNLLDQVQVRPNDGQQLRAGFPIRGSFYLAKDHYLCYVVDDGVNEPAQWQVTEVSATIGICGPNAVDWTEEWAVFAERSGLYIFWGGDPVKINDEIQDDATKSGRLCWNSINWSAGHTVWVRIDRENKRIYVGAPVDGATTPNRVFMMDYSWLSTPQEIAESPLVVYSSYSGKMMAHGRSRKWSPWTVSANSMTFAERSTGHVNPFFGNGVANGKIYQLLDASVQASDNGAAINSHWDSYYCPSHSEEATFSLSALRKLLGYMTFRAIGAGSLLLSVQAANRVTNLRNRTLSTVPAGDFNIPLNLHGERFSISFGTDAVGAWFQLEKFIPFLRKDAAVPVRGR